MKGLIGVLLLAVALAPLSWARADVSFSYVDATLTSNQVDTAQFGEEDAVGADVTISYQVLNLMHVFGTVQYADFDDQPLTQTTGQIGVGYNWNVSPDRKLFVDLSVLNVELELEDPILGTLTGDSDAAELAIGWRETNHTRLEFGVSLHYREYDDTAETTDKWMAMNFLYAVKPRLKVVGGIHFGGDNNNLRIGIRYFLPDRFQQ